MAELSHFWAIEAPLSLSGLLARFSGHEKAAPEGERLGGDPVSTVCLAWFATYAWSRANANLQ